MPLLYRDSSLPDLTIWIADSVAGQERQLSEAIMEQRADLVYLPHADRTSMQRFERMGIPSTPGGTATVWRPMREERVADDQEVIWSSEPAGWIGMDDEALASALPSTSRPCVKGAHYLMAGGQSIARRRDDCILEITSAALDAPTITALPAVLSAAMAGDELVLVPNERASINQELASRGFLPAGIRESYVLTPLLQRSTTVPLIRPFTVSAGDVDEFGRSTGDLNPLHFDDQFAIAHGFERRISHGMIFNGWLTRLLGTEYPGPGTIFLRSTASFHAPVYPDQPYEVRVSTPVADEGRGIYRIVAQLRDAAGKLVTLSYNEVMYRPVPESPRPGPA